ncbi:hypothetical protein UFOVP636_19 [uncultured Caudovirales phage]|jgi:hypothetical protein|uniref:Uncharacterized protein n=1 Tax=uncultured Caudovirales phage TaxID=2100421 RepID=A0A6J5N3N9_9CAUD|nr:hypothetical protein UFOVP636_19 [uncultured Caudovirales phage]
MKMEHFHQQQPLQEHQENWIRMEGWESKENAIEFALWLKENQYDFDKNKCAYHDGFYVGTLSELYSEFMIDS